MGILSPHFFGGEFHYWRTPPDAWEKVFASMRRLGFDTVCTYVPWDFHEISAGRYDFSGKTSAAHNLLRWLKLAQRYRLRVILRPGPYIYAEWNHKGPPARVAKHLRLSKPFLKASRQWIKAVGKAVKPFLASQGGPIAAVQVCNEVTGAFGEEFDKFDDSLLISSGLSKLSSNFPYHWGGSHLDIPQSVSEKRAQDFLEFHAGYTQEYMRRMAQIFRESGFDVPLLANLVSWYWPQRWPDLQRHVDFVAMDSYFPKDLPGNLPAAFAKLYRHFSGISKNPMAVEFGCGVWDGMHERLGWPDEGHLEFTSVLAMSQGLNGLSYYMLVNRDNWYLSPINEWGIVRGRFAAALARVKSILKAMGPGETRPLKPIGLVWRRKDHERWVRAGKSFDHNAFDADWFLRHRFMADYPGFWDIYENLLHLGYDPEIMDEEAHTGRSWPRVTIMPVTEAWDGPAEEQCRSHLKRGGSLILIGPGAKSIALKMPPSIGTPVQKWVRDMEAPDTRRLAVLLRGLGEEPAAWVKGKDIWQCCRVRENGKKILFVISPGNKATQLKVGHALLKEIASGKTWKTGGEIGMPPKAARAFWLTETRRP